MHIDRVVVSSHEMAIFDGNQSFAARKSAYNRQKQQSFDRFQDAA